MKMFCTLLSIVMMLTLTEQMIYEDGSPIVLNPNFYPHRGFKKQGWYSEYKIRPWNIHPQHQHFFHSFYILEWQTKGVKNRSTCLRLNMNRHLKYIQIIGVQSARYQLSAFMGLEISSNFTQFLVVKVRIDVCDYPFVVKLWNQMNPQIIIIGQASFKFARTCYIKIHQRKQEQFGAKVYLSDIKLTKIKITPTKQKSVQKDQNGKEQKNIFQALA